MSTRLRGRVITAGRVYPHAEISFDESGILALTELDPAAAPAEQPTLLPGFVDLHNHGGAGGAFPTGDLAACRRAAEYLRADLLQLNPVGGIQAVYVAGRRWVGQPA